MRANRFQPARRDQCGKFASVGADEVKLCITIGNECIRRTTIPGQTGAWEVIQTSTRRGEADRK